MHRETLIRRLGEGPLLADGGMGTQLFELGLAPGSSSLLWNVEQPELIRRVHERYREAGCDLLTTNSFQGSREALKMHAAEHRAAELNEAAARLAKEAAGDRAWVLADVGPFGGFLEPLGETTIAELTEIFAEQLEALKAGGADIALIETMSDTEEVAVAIGAAKAAGDWPIVSTYAYQLADDRFVTMMGTPVEDAVQRALDDGADVVGANCGTGLGLPEYLRLAEALVAAAGEAPVILQPNAGSPEERDGSLVYPATPAEMAELVPKLLDAGVKILGGCCGTTPRHLAAMREKLNEITASTS